MKCFIKKTADYSAQNKLQLALKDNLGELDRTLHASRQEAEDAVQRVFRETVDAYKGTAKPPELGHYYPGTDTMVFYVSSINLSLYDVKNT